jgi:acyl dehydratase
MLTLGHPRELLGLIGHELGPSDWITVDQAMIDRFADATGDHQWIHVDVERARREMPGGRTIAHGYLTLSLIPRLLPMLLTVEHRVRGLNYGSNRVRFTSPVPADSRVRLRARIKDAEEVPGHGVRVTFECVMEVEDQERPAMAAEIISVQYGVPPA